MIKILEFLIKFINETHLDDHIEMICEPDSQNPEKITIRRIHEGDQDDEY
jgi:hypothetical protein